MISPERLKSFITHEDMFLREAASSYFSDSWSEDGDLIPLVLEACRRWGERDNRLVLSHCRRFRLTNEALAQLLDFLPRMTDELAAEFLNAALALAPVDVFAAAEPAIRAAAKVLPETLARLERRRSLALRSGEDLWQELQDFAERSSDAQYVGEIDHDYVADLIEALARYPVPADDTLCRLIHELYNDEGWLPNFVVDLAGARRLAAAVPPLVDYLEIDTDYLRERVNLALPRIGNPEALRLIGARYPGWPWHARLFSCETLSDLKHAAADDVILRLLEGEEASDLRTNLCYALCKQFSERGLPVVLREIEAGYDPMIVDLKHEVVTLADVLGVDLPQGAAWRRERAEQYRRVRARMDGLEPLLPLPQPRQKPAAPRRPPHRAPVVPQPEAPTSGSSRAMRRRAARRGKGK